MMEDCDDFEDELASRYAAFHDFAFDRHLSLSLAPDPSSPDSLFIQERLSSVIEFPLRRLRLPTSHNAEIGLDFPSNPNDPLYTLTSYLPLIVEPPDRRPPTDANPNQNVVVQPPPRLRQYIFGYREIFLQRQRLRLLRQLSRPIQLNSKPSHKFKYYNESEYGGGDIDRLSQFSALVPIARGGADKNEDDLQDASSKKKSSRTGSKTSKLNSKDTGDRPSGGGPSSKWKAAKDLQQQQQQQQQQALQQQSQPTGKNLQAAANKVIKARKIEEEASHKGKKKKKKHHSGEEQPPTPEGQEPHHEDQLAPAVHETLDSEVVGDEVNAEDTAKTETTIFIDPNIVEVPEVEQRFMKEQVPEIEQDEGPLIVETAEGFGDHMLDEDDFVLVPTAIGDPEERENEWLELSPTNSIEAVERAEAKTLKKEYESWMQTKISFESQNFVGEMWCYLCSSKYTGRSPFYTKYDYNDYVIDFLVDRRKEFIYFTTSIILWLVFVLIVQAMVDVSLLSGDDEYTQKEQEEFRKYQIPSMFIIGQLAVVAFWSVLVLLNYGLRMAHYANTWSVALTEMEINAGKGIFRNTLMNHVAYFVYFFIILLCFIFNYPKNVRGAMGILTILLLRNAIPRAAEDSEPNSYKFITFQIVGLVLHLYIMYCSRIIYNQIQIFAIVLKNASEMWNLKFALRFGQIPTGTSGYLKHLKIRQTLVKIWLHHRLLTALCVQLGEIFVMPIMVTFVMQLGVVVYVLTKIFESSYVTLAKRDKYLKVERFNHSRDNMPELIEDVATMLFILLYLIADFLTLAAYLASAGQAFRDGFEFVRRKGLILCNTSHERRLIQSLQWSFSATNATQINLVGFISVNWETILSFLSIALLLWSLIIQLQQEAKGAIVIYTPNCSQEPRSKRASPDMEGFCRKKIWVYESELDSRVEFIQATFNNTAVDLGKTDRRRRRRRRSVDVDHQQTILDGRPIVLTTYVQTRRMSRHKMGELFHRRYYPDNGNNFGEDDQDNTEHIEGSWKEGAYYYGGNCLQPMSMAPFSASNSKDDPPAPSAYNPLEFNWKSYYHHFHEECYSPLLNQKLIVPKLFGPKKRLWAGRTAVDCGIYPFPFPSYFGHDCSDHPTKISVRPDPLDPGETLSTLDDYDDCGWRKTRVDEIAFASLIDDPNVGDMEEYTIRKIPFVLPSGKTINCWNIFSAIKRCRLIQKLDLGDVCRFSRDIKFLNSPVYLLKSYHELIQIGI